MKNLISLIFILILVSISILTLSCSSGSFEEGYNKGYGEGYDKGWQEGYDKGLEEVGLATTATPKPTSTGVLKELTLEDTEYILNILPNLPTSFERVDAASEGMSNADLGLGPSFSEVQLFISDDPFQMVWGALSVSESRIDQASWDSMMKDESLIRGVLDENIKAGAKQEGIEIGEVETTITNPNIGDSSIYGEGYFESSGLVVGFDTIWFRIGKAYIVLYSAYYSSDKESLIRIANGVRERLNEYSL